MTERDLINALRIGPVRTEQCVNVAANRESLKVRIHRLRAKGYKIRAEKDPDADWKPMYGGGRPPVRYVLEKK